MRTNIDEQTSFLEKKKKVYRDYWGNVPRNISQANHLKLLRKDGDIYIGDPIGVYSKQAILDASVNFAQRNDKEEIEFQRYFDQWVGICEKLDEEQIKKNISGLIPYAIIFFGENCQLYEKHIDLVITEPDSLFLQKQDKTILSILENALFKGYKLFYLHSEIKADLGQVSSEVENGRHIKLASSLRNHLEVSFFS